MKSKYKQVNIKPAAFTQLEELVTLLSTEYAKVKLGTLVTQIITEKYNATINSQK